MKDRTVLLIGAGQSPGEGIGNGRAAALLYAREGARVMAVDVDEAGARETAAMIRGEGGEAIAVRADVRDERALEAAAGRTLAAWGRIDVLHYNVGVSLAGGDRPLQDITEADFDNVSAINLRGYVMAAKHVVPSMRREGRGAIVAIASIAALTTTYPMVAYKTSKAGMIAFTEQLARHNAEFGIRANAVLPGLMNTPMAVDTRARELGRPRAEVAAARDARVPLGRRQGTAWDVARACLFLASDDAAFITGVSLPVDGGALLRGGD
ncbi:MAG: SDR family NAD(P)-dependent oxidoreductase [Lautropia sp.]